MFFTSEGCSTEGRSARASGHANCHIQKESKFVSGHVALAKCVAWCSLDARIKSQGMQFAETTPNVRAMSCDHLSLQGFFLTSDALQRCCLHHGRGELIWMPKSKNETFGGEDDHWDNELAKFCKLNVNRLCYCPALHGVYWLQLLLYRSVAKTPRFQISCAQNIHKWSGLLSKYSTWATSLSKPK